MSRLVIASSIPLPEASVAAPGRPADVAFTCVDAAYGERGDWRWYQHWTLPDGRRWVSLARRPHAFLLAFEGVHFTIAPASLSVRAFRDPATPLVTVRHLLLDQVMPLLASLRGDLALHAGCARTAAGAVAFVGESGKGKSTLVGSFAAAGAAIVTDDALVLEERGGGWHAVRSYPGVRLWPETAQAVLDPRRSRRSASAVAHYNRKVRVLPHESGEEYESVPLRRLYVLAPYEAEAPRAPIRVERLSGREGFLPLIRHTYRLDFEDGAGLKRDFLRLASLVEQDLVRRLVFPMELAELDRVRRAIERDVLS